MVEELVSNIGVVEKLQSFQYKDAKGKDWGLNVRNRAKELANFVLNPDRVRSERSKVFFSCLLALLADVLSLQHMLHCCNRSITVLASSPNLSPDTAAGLCCSNTACWMHFCSPSHASRSAQAKQNESKYTGTSNNDFKDSFGSKESFGSKDTFGSKSSSGYGTSSGP